MPHCGLHHTAVEELQTNIASSLRAWVPSGAPGRFLVTAAQQQRNAVAPAAAAYVDGLSVVSWCALQGLRWKGSDKQPDTETGRHSTTASGIWHMLLDGEYRIKELWILRKLSYDECVRKVSGLWHLPL